MVNMSTEAHLCVRDTGSTLRAEEIVDTAQKGNYPEVSLFDNMLLNGFCVKLSQTCKACRYIVVNEIVCFTFTKKWLSEETETVDSLLGLTR